MDNKNSLEGVKKDLQYLREKVDKIDKRTELQAESFVRKEVCNLKCESLSSRVKRQETIIYTVAGAILLQFMALIMFYLFYK